MANFCVTGGTGFIAAYLVKRLLEDGHCVRTTVRDPGMFQLKEAFLLLQLFQSSILNLTGYPPTRPISKIRSQFLWILYFTRGCWESWFSLGVEWSQGETEDYESWSDGGRKFRWGCSRRWWGLPHCLSSSCAIWWEH